MTKTTPKDVFLYLLSIITLIISVVSFLMLTFQYVNHLIPDALNQYAYGVVSRARGATAALIVAWPIYVLMLFLINQDIRRQADKLELKVRRWLMYLTLFIASLTMIIDLISLLNNFLNGELTLRFALKTLIVLITAAGVFGYYLWDIRRSEGQGQRLPQTMAWTLSAMIMAVVAAGFFILGTPQQQRALRLDQQRVNDLQTLQYSIQNYYDQYDVLPSSLNELSTLIDNLPQDPETGNVYIYQVTGSNAFKICATFTQASENQSSEPYLYPPVSRTEKGSLIIRGQSWQHGPGEVCFERTIVADNN